jgi:transposase InsO family protein
MLERISFVREFLRGEESMSELCRYYGISRKTGYKWVERYDPNEEGCLWPRSRAPHHSPNQLSKDVVQAIISLRERHPKWGPKKLLVKLKDLVASEMLPCASTVANVLARHGLSQPRRRVRRATPSTQPLAHATDNNRVWCIDFKGWFHTGDGARIHPLTVTDAHSRYLLCLQAMSRKTDSVHVAALLRRVFEEYGLPERIRSDNGSPFASTGLAGLSRLSAWWIRLGIMPERIEPGEPSQNGRHERFHLTLKNETATPPAPTFAQQQRRFKTFHTEYNDERPHEALGQTTPGSLYTRSSRLFPQKLKTVEYGKDVVVRSVGGSGRIKWKGTQVRITKALLGERVGLKPIADGIYRIYYCDHALGYFDERTLKAHSTIKQLPKSARTILLVQFGSSPAGEEPSYPTPQGQNV